MTEDQLKEIEKRLAKGWVIRRDEIEALIAAVRLYRDHPLQVIGSQHIPVDPCLCPGGMAAYEEDE